jgi:hypothetical protein
VSNYLDEAVWQPDGVGVVGPVGLLAAASLDSKAIVYASLPVYAQEAPSIPADLEPLLVDVDNRATIAARYPQIVEKVPALDHPAPTHRDEEWFMLGLTVNSESDALRTFMVVRPRYEDRRQAQLFYWWLDERYSFDHATTLSLWNLVQHRLVKRGFSGVVTQYESDRLYKRYTSEFRLFSTALDAVKSHGLMEYIS